MTVKSVGVVGSGIMGGGITHVAALAGHEVVLLSRELSTAEGTVASLEKAFKRQVDKGSLSSEDRDGTIARITATDNLHDLSRCDLVIESVVEDLATKRRLFSDLDR
ncbi:MAG: 3-hydroxyacyl-CoA dehydrogenase family protein, partial [Acidimicrobiales bacterium]